MEERERFKVNWIFTFAIGILLGLGLRTCSERTPNIIQIEPQKEVEKREAETDSIKTEVRYLKQIVEVEDKRRADSLKHKLDSLMSIENFSKDTALTICLDVIELKEIVIKRQDTIIFNQDKIIYNDSIVKNLLKEEIILNKKKHRKNMFIGVGAGILGGMIISFIVI